MVMIFPWPVHYKMSYNNTIIIAVFNHQASLFSLGNSRGEL